jgi:predicted tellurium resistance membrane protein TerC
VFEPRVLFSAEGLASFVSLAAMEIVLGIDNVIMVAILSQKVAPGSRQRVRRLGISLALALRIGLLLTLSWLMSLTRPLFQLFGNGFSGRDLVLLAGGLFLMAKATLEIHERMASAGAEAGPAPPAAEAAAGFASTLVQILLLDIVFSLDSVITAVGMARAVVIMIAAMVASVGVMLLFADAISEFINRHPNMKVLALAFLLLIGFLLVADTFGHHIDKGYVYFAMAFALAIELVNMRARKKARRR